MSERWQLNLKELPFYNLAKNTVCTVHPLYLQFLIFILSFWNPLYILRKILLFSLSLKLLINQLLFKWFNYKLLKWLEDPNYSTHHSWILIKGVIHKPRGQFFGYFWPPPHSTFVIVVIWLTPPPSTIHVHIVQNL